MHGGEVYKGLLRKGNAGSFILSHGWVVHTKATSNEELGLFVTFWY
jgi:hypothetical protein